MENEQLKAGLITDYYVRHYDELCGYVGSRLSFAEETEDIVQNVFVRLLQMDKMITPVSLPNLVYTIARNLIFDYWKHCRYVEEYEHFISKGDVRSLVVDDAESVYSANEITELLERGVARLTTKQRAVYRLNVMDGLQVSEIAIKLHINYKNAENRLGAARKQVRSYMRKMLA